MKELEALESSTDEVEQGLEGNTLKRSVAVAKDHSTAPIKWNNSIHCDVVPLEGTVGGR